MKKSIREEIQHIDERGSDKGYCLRHRISLIKTE